MPQTLRSLAACCAMLAAIASDSVIFSADQATGYAERIAQWRAHREAGLKADEGWLTLVGLTWLSPGDNRAGSDPANDVVIPSPSAAARLGVFTLAGDGVTFRPEPGANVLVNGQPARAQVLQPQPGRYDVVSSGTTTMFVIKRGLRYGVRIRDTASEARRAFTGLHWYPIRDTYRVTARFVAHARATQIMVPNVLGDLDPWTSPGYAVFSMGGREVTLQAVYEGSDTRTLFFIFRDLTTGTDTYPGGRFLYADAPVDGTVVLDFNKAHSPPCAFTPYATCPVPPRENALPVRVEAGELNPHR